MDYVAVSSSNIAAVAYDDAARVLDVRLLNGTRVPVQRHGPPVYLGFMGAVSKGGHFTYFVKEAYACARVR